jgi:hypothetical protein
VCSVHLYFMCGFTVPNDQLSFEFFKQSVNERGPTRQTIDFDCIAQQNSWESIHPSLCALVRSIFGTCLAVYNMVMAIVYIRPVCSCCQIGRLFE